jgi:hypothetical protein
MYQNVFSIYNGENHFVKEGCKIGYGSGQVGFGNVFIEIDLMHLRLFNFNRLKLATLCSATD